MVRIENAAYHMIDVNGVRIRAAALVQWYFFTQAPPLPENMILNDREEFFRYSLHIARYHSENDTSSEAFPKEIYDEYYRLPADGTIPASQTLVYPPSTGIAAPVMNLALSQQRKVMMDAISKSSPILCMGWISRYFCFSDSGTRGVLMTPGQTQLTRMPCPA